MEFPYEKIVKLAERIENMRDKKYKNDLKQIKKIIENTNPDIKERMTKNNNGYFLPDFESYNYETYAELTKFFEKIDNHENKENSDNLSTHKKNVALSEKTDERSENNATKKLKYTNSENHILNKIKYEKALKQHQSECFDDIYRKDNNIENLTKLLKKNENDKKDADKIFKKQCKKEKEKSLL